MEGYNLQPGPLIGCNDEYRLVRKLGVGSGGEVWLAVDARQNELAIKFISASRANWKYVMRELVNQQGHQCPQIVKFFEVFRIDSHICMVMEYLPGGTLAQYLSDMGGVFREEWALWYFQQMASGLLYLHKNDVFMRDLKLQNMVLNEEKTVVKLCDYGLSKLHSTPDTFLGTPAYLCPELLLKHRMAGYNAKIEPYDGEAVDVWTLGVCLYTMLYGKYPFEDPADNRPGAVQRMFFRIERCSPDIPAFQRCGTERLPVSDGARKLLRKIFVKNPAARITLDEIIETEWFKQDLPEGGAQALKSYMVQANLTTGKGVLSPAQLWEKVRFCIPETPPSLLSTMKRWLPF